MARQVEIALADSLRERPVIVQRQQQAQSAPSSFWGFLGNVFDGRRSSPSPTTTTTTRYSAPRHEDVRGLMRAFVDRSASIEAMWVVNAEGQLLYTSVRWRPRKITLDDRGHEQAAPRRNHHQHKTPGKERLLRCLGAVADAQGVRSPGGLRLWLNPADWTGLLSGLWHQLTLLFVLGGGVALVAAFLTTTLYTRRFRLIADTLRQAEAGTYAARPQYGSQDEVGVSLDLIDRLVMKQRKNRRRAGAGATARHRRAHTGPRSENAPQRLGDSP